MPAGAGASERDSLASAADDAHVRQLGVPAENIAARSSLQLRSGDGTPLSSGQHSVTAVTDEARLWRMCGMPLNIDVRALSSRTALLIDSARTHYLQQALKALLAISPPGTRH